MDQFHRDVKIFERVVIWGLKTQWSTHRYIHHHYFTNLNKLGIPVVWVDNDFKNQYLVTRNNLVISVNLSSSCLPIKDGVYYCLHNCSEDVHAKIAPSHNIKLQVYTNASVGEKWDEVTYFDRDQRTLYQPWGTDLLAHEFREPVFNNRSKFVFWVGSVWGGSQGNRNEINHLKKALAANKLHFIHNHKFPISNSMNIWLTRQSRIAPAISGKWQEDNNYLPCRMFKNISYGQLGISNVPKFYDLFKGCSIKGNIEELIDTAMGLGREEYISLVKQQQEIAKSHTYMQKFHNIAKAFQNIENV
jgi:hypothetical protein